MGTIKTTNIETITGSGTLTLGTSGETISIPSGVSFTPASGTMSGQNYPAFEATVGTTTNVTNQVITKMAFDTEVFDTDNCYDPTTNYRFTPTVAGKYQVQSMAILAGDQNTLNSTIIYLYKNGSEVIQNQFRDTTNEMHRNGHNLSVIVDMNGTTDYLEMFCRIENDSGTPQYFSTGSNFQAYRIGA